VVLDFIKKIIQNKQRNYVFITQVINALIALISGKLIAVYISPEDFGNYNIQFTTYTFFSTLLINPFLQFLKATNTSLLLKIGSKQYLRTLFFIICINYVLYVTFLYFYYNIFNVILLVIFLLFIFISTINSILSDYLNIHNQIIEFSKLSLVKSLSGLIFITVFLVLGLKFMDHIQALWMIQLVGVLVATAFFISKYEIIKTSFKIGYNTFLKKYLRFGTPLIFLAFWLWINNFFDRYAIEYFMGMKEVGIYNASYAVGSKFFLLLSPIFAVLLTPIVYAVSKKEIKKKAINKYGVYYFILGIPSLFIIYLIKDYLGNLLLSEAYQDGFNIIFWIAATYFILTLAQLYELIFYAEQKTKVILSGNIISAILNVILNITLIPTYGIMGAAIASCCGFTIYFVIVYYNFLKI
tara:strand:+ start:2586 stop:3818 length:1233 start_codon:yes stop_codon:yes gene_type:complete